MKKDYFTNNNEFEENVEIEETNEDTSEYLILTLSISTLLTSIIILILTAR